MKTGDLLYCHQLSLKRVLEKYRVHQRMSAVFNDTILKCHGKISGGDLGALPGKTKLYGSSSLGLLPAAQFIKLMFGQWEVEGEHIKRAIVASMCC